MNCNVLTAFYKLYLRFIDKNGRIYMLTRQALSEGLQYRINQWMKHSWTKSLQSLDEGN